MWNNMIWKTWKTVDISRQKMVVAVRLRVTDKHAYLQSRKTVTRFL